MAKTKAKTKAKLAAKASSSRETLNQLRELAPADLTKYIAEQKRKLMEDRFGRVAQKPVPAHVTRQTRRNVARAFTLLRQKAVVAGSKESLC